MRRSDFPGDREDVLTSLRQVGFDAGLGLELVHVVGQEKVEVFLGFAGEDQGGGGQAVFAAVGRAAGLSFGGDGAVGFGSVDSRRFAF